MHERSFGLDGVVQVVGCPGVQHLCQSDGTQRGMLFRPSQVFIRHLFEQVILTRFCGGVECGGYLIDCSYMTGLMINAFTFEAMKEGFCHGIVIAIGSAAHAHGHVILLQKPEITFARISTATIRVME